MFNRTSSQAQRGLTRGCPPAPWTSSRHNTERRRVRQRRSRPPVQTHRAHWSVTRAPLTGQSRAALTGPSREHLSQVRHESRAHWSVTRAPLTDEGCREDGGTRPTTAQGRGAHAVKQTRVATSSPGAASLGGESAPGFRRNP